MTKLKVCLISQSISNCYVDSFGVHTVDEIETLPPRQLVVVKKVKSKKLHKCEKCGKVGENLTKHSLNGHHKPPFIWLCRTPCHDEYHNMLPKKYIKKQSNIAKMTELKVNIQFTGNDFNIEKFNPYLSIINSCR